MPSWRFPTLLLHGPSHQLITLNEVTLNTHLSAGFYVSSEM